MPVSPPTPEQRERARDRARALEKALDIGTFSVSEIEIVTAAFAAMIAEGDEWRAKALDVETHPAVVALKADHATALAAEFARGHAAGQEQMREAAAYMVESDWTDAQVIASHIRALAIEPAKEK